MYELVRRAQAAADVVFCQEAAIEDVVSKDAYISDALFHLDWVRVTINDALTGSNDGELKRSLLQDLDAADLDLRKALA